MTEPGKTCSHGRTWDEPCRECQLLSARDLVAHWGGQVDEARKVIASASKAQEEATGNVLLKVGGKPFRCRCGCNVFHRLPSVNIEYKCNACELQYEAEL